ncbi:DNA topoisomerase III [Morganella morganii]|nr:DNA topoisomerase III [Morganella morganii]
MKLFLCEKPSQAKDIARVIGANQRLDNFYQGNGVQVAWARGHLLEQAEPDAYGVQYAAPWRQTVLPIIPENWQMVVKKDAVSLFRTIKNLLGKATEVVIATDADREGEVIARELLEACHYKKTVQRLWLSALDEASIREALKNLLPGEKTASLYSAGLGRSRADWLIGINMTRLFTIKANELGFGGVLSVGRVQTPTLALIVRREREIKHFISKPFWRVTVLLQHNGMVFQALWQPASQYCDDEHRCVNVQAAQAVVQLCRETGKATVFTVNERREKALPPLPFDLGTLQQAASKRWGYSADKVLEIAQSLYEKHKATTYPRTDCGYLPVSMRAEIPAVLSALAASDITLNNMLERLQTELVSRAWNDAKITAHHGIIPTKHVPDLNVMNEAELNVYQLIRAHYLAQFLPAQEWDVTEILLDIAGQRFVAKGKVERIRGWSVLVESKSEEDDLLKEGTETENDVGSEKLPSLREGEYCAIQQAEARQLATTPPKPYTDGTLIAAMKNASSFVTDPTLKKVLKENAGLGTEATRAGIITTLENRKLIFRQKKTLRATETGCQLIDSLPAAFTDPGMTALWEQSLEQVALGQLSLDVFMQKQITWLEHLIKKGGETPLNLNLPPMPLCPECQGKMSLRESQKGRFWSCQRYPDCKGIIPLAGETRVIKGGKRKGKRSAARANVTDIFS